MRLTVCTLNFNDGASLSGSVSVASPQSEGVIAYTGSVDRLPRRYKRGDGTDLKALFTVLANELGADLQVQESGEYDYYAV